jgi:hypothetical protein
MQGKSTTIASRSMWFAEEGSTYHTFTTPSPLLPIHTPNAIKNDSHAKIAQKAIYATLADQRSAFADQRTQKLTHQ